MIDDVILQEAVDAIRDGNKARAKELLTGLIKQNQNNADYWVWMSSVMETQKERVYCLQTAFKLDPENASAKRGLILLGAMPGDETVPPFSMNRPRKWEEDLLLAHEKPKLKGWAAVRASPITRLVIVLLLVGGIGASIAFGYVIPAMQENRFVFLTYTPGPSPTYTLTVTSVGGSRPTVAPIGTAAAPLSELLDKPYTPTPLYVQTESSPLISDYLIQFNIAYQREQWDEAIAALEKVVAEEPNAAFAYYYMGEALRFKGNPGQAQQRYSKAIEVNPDFGAAYVGLSKAQLESNPNANVLPLLDKGVELDPNFGEAYLERARVKIRDNDIQGAITDLGEANSRLSGSPLIFFYLAQARYKEGDYEVALEAAQRANELDITHLPTYQLLGLINAKLGNTQQAIEYLTTYLTYTPQDTTTFFQLGTIYFEDGNYDGTIQIMDRIIKIDRNRREPYYYRFLSNIELGNGDAADADIDRIITQYEDSFDANMSIVRLHLMQNRNGSALQIIEKAAPLAESDKQKAIFYYWKALTHEQRKEAQEAADTWKLLLDLPTSAVSADMRKEAQAHLDEIRPPTPTRTPTNTKVPTATKPVTPTKTPSPTETSSGTTTVTATFTPTPTSTP